MNRHSRPSTHNGSSTCCICFKGFRWESHQLVRAYRDERSATFTRKREEEKERFRFLPRILMCRHNACDNCIRKAFSSPNEITQCNICRKRIDLPPSFQESDVDSMFPVNYYLLGTLCPGLNTEFFGEDGDGQVSFLKSAVTKRKSPVPQHSQTSVQMCTECRGVGGSFCDSCAAVFCHPCFTTVHAKAKVLMSHKSTPLVQKSSQDKVKHSMCSFHPQFKREFFCIPCTVAICTECLISEHNGHKLKNIAEKNRECVEEVIEAYTNASNVQRTAKMSIKYAKKALMATDKGGDETSYKAKIKDHFLLLHSHLVRLESELLAQTNTSRRARSLNAAVDHLTVVCERINQALEKTKIQVQNESCADFYGLIKELRELENMPCVLVQVENNGGSNWFFQGSERRKLYTLNIDDSIFSVLDEHVSLRVNDSIDFAVRSVDEVPEEATSEVNKLTVNGASAELKIKLSLFEPRFISAPVKSDYFPEEIPHPLLVPLHKTSSNRRGSDSSNVSVDSSLDSYSVESTYLLTPPETLITGVSFSVDVTHITSPSDFYVQRCGIKSKLNMLTQELTRYSIQSKRHKKGSKRFIQGDICVTKYRRDNAWTRCEILSCKPDNSTVEVRYIDFGTTDKVDSSNVYHLPVSLANIPPLAIKCSLARIKPASKGNSENGEWDLQVAEVLLTMLRGSLKKAIVILNEGFEDSAQVRLVVEHDICPIDVAMSLVYLGYAELDFVVYPILDDRNLKITFRKYKSQRQLCADEMGDTFFELAHVESPDEFYIRIPAQAEFKKFHLRLQGECKRKAKWCDGDPIRIFWPSTGMSAAVLSDNQHWERATIIEPLPDRLLHVFLVDVGRHEIVEWTRAQVLDIYFFTFPPQAFKCSLLDIAPVDGDWSSDANDFLRSFQDSKTLKVKSAVWNPTSRRTEILLTKTGLSTVVSINALLVNEGYAVATGPCGNEPELAKSPQNRGYRGDEDEDPSESVTLSREPGGIDLKVFEDAVTLGPDKRYRVKVSILKAISPAEFYLTFDYLDKEYDQLFHEMDEFFKREDVKSPEKLWKPNEKCAVRDGSNWKRAKVLEDPIIDELGRTMVKVKFLDEIKEVSVPTTTLMNLPPHFLTLGERVVPCCLGGIVPAPSGEWSQSSIREFQEFLSQSICLKLFMARMKNFDADDTSVVRVELFSLEEEKPTSLGGFASTADPPHEPVWTSINHKLRMKGMAKPDEHTIWDSRGQRKYTTDKFTDDSDEERFNLMEDDMEVLAHMMRSAFYWTPENGIDISRPRIAEGHRKTRWFPPRTLTSLTFAGRVTFVGPHCDIYIQDFMHDANELKLINDEIFKMCSEMIPEENEWEVGDICVAKFYVDNRWYRGEIDQGYNEGCYLVKFVDYGNLEWVLPEDLRKPRGMTMRPIQAHICYFDNFAPIQDKWEKPQLEEIHSFLVDKICRVNLRNLSSGFLGIVQMSLPECDDVLQELVSRRLGKYINVPAAIQGESKPAIPETNSTDAEVETEFCSESETSADRRAEMPANPAYWWDWYRDNPKMESSPSYQLMKIPDDVESLAVDIVSIITPDFFLVQVFDTDNPELVRQQSTFMELQSILQSEGELQELLLPPYEFKECCCKFAEDGVWYRGLVLQVLDDSKSFHVQYVDYGNVEEKLFEEVRQLKKDWISVPLQTIPCRIAGYKFSGVISPIEANFVLNAVFEEVPDVTAVIKERDGECLHVELRNTSGSLVYQNLIDNGFFVPY